MFPLASLCNGISAPISSQHIIAEGRNVNSHRSFMAQARQVRQQFANTQDAPARDGMSPIASRSRRSLPITRRLQVVGPTSLTIACTRMGTRHATGVIGEIGIAAPHNCSVYCGTRDTLPQGESSQIENLVKFRRGYAGRAPRDCIIYHDYRSADFAGPLVPA